MAVNFLAVGCKNSIIPFLKGLLMILDMKYKKILTLSFHMLKICRQSEGTEENKAK